MLLIGTIPDDNSISHESDRRSPCTLFPRGRDQSGTASLPLLTFMNSSTLLFIYFIQFQGMDQRAERVVHNSMVNVTCKSESAQYFLITPKLLPDLMYHERMKILCVNNGEWLPDDRNSGKMMNMIDGYVASRRKWKDIKKTWDWTWLDHVEWELVRKSLFLFLFTKIIQNNAIVIIFIWISVLIVFLF